MECFISEIILVGQSFKVFLKMEPFYILRRELLTQRSAVPSTIPSVFYAHLVPSGRLIIESWHMSLNENACIGWNA